MLFLTVIVFSLSHCCIEYCTISRVQVEKECSRSKRNYYWVLLHICYCRTTSALVLRNKSLTLSQDANVLLTKHQVAKLNWLSSKANGPSPPVGIINSSTSVSDKPYSVQARIEAIRLAAANPIRSSSCFRTGGSTCGVARTRPERSTRMSVLRRCSFCTGVRRIPSGGRAEVATRWTPAGSASGNQDRAATMSHSSGWNRWRSSRRMINCSGSGCSSIRRIIRVNQLLR